MDDVPYDAFRMFAKRVSKLTPTHVSMKWCLMQTDANNNNSCMHLFIFTWMFPLASVCVCVCVCDHAKLNWVTAIVNGGWMNPPMIIIMIGPIDTLVRLSIQFVHQKK